jgi:hypothetical protein
VLIIVLIIIISFILLAYKSSYKGYPGKGSTVSGRDRTSERINFGKYKRQEDEEKESPFLSTMISETG